MWKQREVHYEEVNRKKDDEIVKRSRIGNLNIPTDAGIIC